MVKSAKNEKWQKHRSDIRRRASPQSFDKVMFNRKLCTLYKFLGLSLVFFGIGFAGCQPVKLTTLTPVHEPEAIIETEAPLNQVEPTVSIAAATQPTTTKPAPIIEPTLMATDASTSTPGSLSAPSRLQKVDELSIKGQVLAISPDGTLIAAMSNSSLVLNVFDVTQQEIKWQFESDTYGFTDLAFSADGKLLAAGGIEQQVFVWDVASGNLLHNLSVPFTKIERVSFSPDNRLLAASAPERFSHQDADIILWEIDSGQVIDTFPSQKLADITIPDKHNNVSVDYATWNIIDISFVPHSTNLLAMTVLNHYEQVEGSSGALYFWDIDGEKLQEIVPGMTGQNISVSPNGNLLATEIDEQIIIWDIQNNLRILEINPKDSETTARLALTDNGILVRLVGDKTLTIWNLQGEMLDTLETEAETFITDMVVAPNGDLLIASFIAGKDAFVEVWQIAE